ncbi:histidinol-phosphatase HisJ [Acetobacterium fimetarium]|uniref:Histidinol-phosphatase n=2 Tax=Acetobacterium fimetarium TaxID=52691 RepID=A0ABR6WX31_9FIRM|nr:histidinol-phosphatase HisJ [Acetobacterium fimetarium]
MAWYNQFMLIFGGIKMIQANFHIHSEYCDGQNTLEEMTKAGIAAGLKSIGFASHMPLPFKNDWTMDEAKLSHYFEEISDLKEKYASSIEIYCGMEIDYFIDRQDISELAKEILPKLDYTIMSIHTIGSTYGNEVSYIDDTREDFARGIKNYYDNQPQQFIEAYYKGIGEMVLRHQPDVLGHIDLIKKYNQENFFFDENDFWYQETVKKCLDTIAETRTRMEINTGANMRVPGVGRYPSDWMIPEMEKRKIQITVGGDSHSVEGIVNEYNEAEMFLLSCGYKEYWMLKKGRWEAQALGV